MWKIIFQPTRVNYNVVTYLLMQALKHHSGKFTQIFPTSQGLRLNSICKSFVKVLLNQNKQMANFIHRDISLAK